MADFVNIKRPPPSVSPLYDAAPASDECFDHCITLNAEDLEKVGLEMPTEKGDTVHFSAMAKVVGFGDDHGHRYIRLEVEDVLFAENETTESKEGDSEE